MTLAQFFGLFALLVAILIAFSRVSPLLSRIPPEILAVCFGLIVLTTVLLWRLLRQRRAVLRHFEALRAVVGALPVITAAERQSGLPQERVDRVIELSQALPPEPARSWLAVEDSLVLYRWADGEQGWFLDRPAEEILPLEAITQSSYHASFHAAIPGVLTALGLLATFTSILIALAGVSYRGQPGAPVRGIDGLINGLSGKFLSSIVALILSVVFTFVEKLACERRFQREYVALRDMIRRRLPALRPLQVLLDIREALDARVAGRAME